MSDEIDRILAAHRKELDAFKARIQEVERKIDLIQRRLRMPIREEGPAGSNPPPAP